jgi:hypothetical protein
MNDRQLRWIQKARSGQVSGSLVGPLAREWVKTLGRGAPAWRQRLLGVLQDEVGASLLDYAEPISISRGVLTFRVTEPAMAYHLRLTWEQRLLQLMMARLPQSGVHTIRFTVGRQ